MSCIVGHNSRPFWWNNVVTKIGHFGEKNRNEWFEVEYTDDNFSDYDDLHDEETWDDTMYSEKNQFHNSKRHFKQGKVKNIVCIYNLKLVTLNIPCR